MNKVILLGNICQDLELKQTQSGTSVVSFNFATNEKVKKGEEWEDKATFHNIVAWGKIAEVIANHCKSGTKLLIEGKLDNRTWETAEGVKKYKTEIIVSNFEFTGGKKDNSSDFEKSDYKYGI